MEKNEVITLEDRGFIHVNGPEAKDFLQNIVTNDIEKVTSSSTVFSSILTPQGKYLFEFFVLKLKDSYLLECEKKSTTEIIKLLNFYKLSNFFKFMKPKRVFLDDRVNRSSSFNVEDFENHISELLNYCKIIKKQKDTKCEKCGQEIKCVKCDHITHSHDEFNEKEQTLMKNWVVIRLFSLLEFHLKAVFSDLIDDLNINPKRIVGYDSISIDLNVLEHFKSEQYTKGRVIIANFDKMNPKIIKTIMDKINRLDFYKWYSVLIPKAKETEELIYHLHMKRNDVTHNLVDIKDDSVAKLVKDVRAFKDLLTHYQFFTELNIGIFISVSCKIILIKPFLNLIIAILISNKSTIGSEAYFDLSDQEIKIETDFNGKEVIIFGLNNFSNQKYKY